MSLYTTAYTYVYCSLFIMLCFGPKSIDCVISESCNKGTNLQSYYRKMIISWSFSYNSFVKFYGKNILEPQLDRISGRS